MKTKLMMKNDNQELDAFLQVAMEGDAVALVPTKSAKWFW